MTRKGFFQTITAAAAVSGIADPAPHSTPPVIGRLATDEDLADREESVDVTTHSTTGGFRQVKLNLGANANPST